MSSVHKLTRCAHVLECLDSTSVLIKYHSRRYPIHQLRANLCFHPFYLKSSVQLIHHCRFMRTRNCGIGSASPVGGFHGTLQCYLRVRSVTTSERILMSSTLTLSMESSLFNKHFVTNRLTDSLLLLSVVTLYNW